MEQIDAGDDTAWHDNGPQELPARPVEPAAAVPALRQVMPVSGHSSAGVEPGTV